MIRQYKYFCHRSVTLLHPFLLWYRLHMVSGCLCAWLQPKWDSIPSFSHSVCVLLPLPLYVCLYPNESLSSNDIFIQSVHLISQINWIQSRHVRTILFATIMSALAHIRQTILPNKISIFFVVAIASVVIVGVAVVVAVLVVIVVSSSEHFSLIPLSVSRLWDNFVRLRCNHRVSLKFMFKHVMPANISIHTPRRTETRKMVDEDEKKIVIILFWWKKCACTSKIFTPSSAAHTHTDAARCSIRL